VCDFSIFDSAPFPLPRAVAVIADAPPAAKPALDPDHFALFLQQLGELDVQQLEAFDALMKRTMPNYPISRS